MTESTKRVLDVGNCDYDHSSIASIIGRSFQADVVRAHAMNDALKALETGKFDLVLVNRLMDETHESGLAIIQEIKRRPETANVPVMMITNYADHQQTAVASGAEPGFGKRELKSEETRLKLARFLE